MPVNDVINKIVQAHPYTFNNPCGTGYAGGTVGYSTGFFNLSMHHKNGDIWTQKIKRNDFIIINPQFITFGLEPGSGDRIGWHPLIITPDMIGSQVAVFLSCEAKSVNDRMRENQINWKEQVIKAGGIAEVWQEKKDGSIICL